jgi:hypothetical protein
VRILALLDEPIASPVELAARPRVTGDPGPIPATSSARPGSMPSVAGG